MREIIGYMITALGSGANFLRRVWRIMRWPLGILAVAYIGLVISRIPAVTSQQKSAEAVAFIKAQHLTLADADGSRLPPQPDPKIVDATVAGIDANENGIRDDVELAIFKKYPNSPYTRAAELQYAMAEQMFLTQVFSTATWKAAAEEDGRASLCISTLSNNKAGDLRKEVEDIVFNTSARIDAQDNAYQYMTSHGAAPGEPCDIDAGQLRH